jgi:hypothetical protein
MARFIKLYDLSDHWLFENSDYFKWWVDLLFLAAWENKKFMINGSLVQCERGQLAWSQISLSKRWKSSRQTVRTFIKLLEKDSMIAVETNQHTSIITICNYDKYQDKKEIAQPTDNQRLTIDKPTVNHIQERLEILERLEDLFNYSCSEPNGSKHVQNSKTNFSAISPGNEESAKAKPFATDKEADSEYLFKRPGMEPSKYSGSEGIGTDAKSDVVFELPLNEKDTFHYVTSKDVAGFEELFPAVDVLHEMKLMRQWFKDNPQKKKTKSGIGRFMTNWLAKAQNSGGNKGYLKNFNPVPGRYTPTTEDIYADF